MPYTIHEFSTGLTIELILDGGWKSKGYTGTWMNSTVDPDQIPKSITDAIRDDKFEARSVSKSQPGIIGCVIQGNDDKYWSVIAIIILGLDDSGRTFSTYRYFWCEGKENLSLIIGWFYKQNTIPVFDPFGTPSPVIIDDEEARKYREITNQKTNNINNEAKLKEWLTANFPPPIICSSTFLINETIPLLIMDIIATSIAGGQYLVSWAYNVVALNKPEQFLLILSADDKAYQNFFRLKPIQQYYSAGMEIIKESDLKSAIQDLIYSKNIQQNLITINKILENLKDQDVSQIEQYFSKVFDKLGATDALKHNMYNVGMLELLTLRAILLPKTLTEYLSYVHLDEEQKSPFNLLFFKKDSSIKHISLDFQDILIQGIKSSPDIVTNLKAKLRDGLIIATQEFFQENISKNTLMWLINSHDSLWSLGSQEFTQTITSDLQKIKSSDVNKLYSTAIKKNKPIKLQGLNLNIWHNLITNYPIRPDSQLKYESLKYESLRIYKTLGDIFLLLKNYQLAFYFYTISGYKISHQILTNLQKHGIDNVFGIRIPVNNNTSPEFQFTQTYFTKNQLLKNNTYIVGILFGVMFIVVITFLSTLIKQRPEKNSYINSPSPSSSSHISANLTQKYFLNKAADLFWQPRKTYDAINQTWENLQSDKDINKKLEEITLTQQLSEREKQTIKQDIFTSALDSVLGLEAKNSYKNIFDDQPNQKSDKRVINKRLQSIVKAIYNDQPNQKSDKRVINKRLQPIVKAIYNYQNKNAKFYYLNKEEGRKYNRLADGIIDKVDINKFPNSTMAVLQKDIKQQIINDTNNNKEKEPGRALW
jgi:hypothetical protein